MTHDTYIALSFIGLLSLASQWVAWRVKLPAILFLLVSGITIGPIIGYIQPDKLFGSMLMPIISLSVAIILFEGSLTLNFSEVRGLARVIRNLISVGLLISWLLITVLSHWVFGFDWFLAPIFGAITSVTGPTVVMPILKTVHLKKTVSNILRWEAVLVDAAGAMLAVLVFGFVITAIGNQSFIVELAKFFEVLIIGVVAGLIFGMVLGLGLRRHWFPEYLQNMASLIMVVVCYTIGNYFNEGTGLVSVAVMGIVLANTKDIYLSDIINFKESLSIFLISGLFIILAARIHLSHISHYLLPAIIMLVLIQFVVRPAVVYVSTYGSEMTWREKCILAWIAPRGIVAAAIAALFAIRLRYLGYPYAESLVLPCYLIIIGTVLWQSATAGLVAKLLDQRAAVAKGVFILGANKVALLIADALRQAGFDVMLADMHWGNVSAARLQGFQCYYGNVFTQYAALHIDLSQFGTLLALAPQNEWNMLAMWHFQAEFGHRHMYMVASEARKGDQLAISRLRQNVLFSKDMSFGKLLQLVHKGARYHFVKITDHYSLDDFRKAYPDCIALFAFSDKQHIHIITSSDITSVKSGWTLVIMTQ